MAPLDSLPGDQRAVLQLVLGRGRSYDEIAGLLSIKPVAVRERALAALDALGPQTKVDRERRGMITDYLLGQLSEDEAADVRGRLSASAGDRAWARVVSSELAPLANKPLPEIPAAGARDAEADSQPAAAAAAESEPASEIAEEPEQEPTPSQTRSRRRRRGGAAAAGAAAAAADAEAAGTDADAADGPGAGTVAAGAGAGAGADKATADAGADKATAGAPAADAGGADPQSADRGASAQAGAGTPRSSRLGGAVLIGAAVVVVALVLFLVLNSGGSSKHPAASASVSSSTPAAASTTASGSSTSASSTAKVVAQVNLTPTIAGSKAAGIAEVLKEGTSDGIAIVAQNVPPNSKSPPNAYAVWLYNSPTDAHILGFVNPAVGTNGRLSTAGALPTNAAHYKELIVTVETTASPKTPGQIILQGPLKGV